MEAYRFCVGCHTIIKNGTKSKKSKCKQIKLKNKNE